MKRLSRFLLLWAERLFLHAHGWHAKDQTKKDFFPPDDYPFRKKYNTYTHGHAVNAQKQASQYVR